MSVVSVPYEKLKTLVNPSESKREERAGERTGTDIGGQSLQPPDLKALSKINSASIKGLEPFRRYTYSTIQLCQVLNRPPTFEEAWSWYHDQGFHTGEDRNHQRQRGIQEAVEYVASAHDWGKTSTSYERWLDPLSAVIEPADLLYAGARKLKVEQVAFQFNLYVQQMGRGNDSCRKTYILAAARQAKAEGKTAFCIDHKQKAAIERLLVKKGWIELSEAYRYSKEAKSPNRYRFGPNSPVQENLVEVGGGKEEYLNTDDTR